MPYIKQEDRQHLAYGNIPTSPGELNYEITNLIKLYWNDHPNYQGINDILGALEGAKLEFYRRVVVPYEDTKIKENGDVY
jgi:hypothetical protein